MRRVTVAFTGHRKTSGLVPTEGASVSLRILHYLADVGPRELSIPTYAGVRFLIGGATGADSLAMMWCRRLGIPFTVYLPFPFEIHTKKWSDAQRGTLQNYLFAAERVVTVGDEYDVSLYQERNQRMVGESDEVACVWDHRKKGGTYNTILHAVGKGRPVYSILLEEYLNADTVR